MSKRTDAWPVLKRYDRDHLAMIALPLGGIGTGTVSLGGRGNLKDWEVVNRPAKGFTPPNTFFALRAQPHGGEAVTRCLEGPVDPSEYEGEFGPQATGQSPRCERLGGPERPGACPDAGRLPA